MTRPHLFAGGAALCAALAIVSSAGAQCRADTDCRAGRTCKKGRCAEVVCSRDVDCPNDGICEGGVCKVPAVAPIGPLAPAPAAPPAPLAPTVAYRTESRLIPALYIAGPVVLGASWLTTIAVTGAVSAGGSDAGKDIGFACIPVVGPWVLLGQSGSGSYAGGLVTAGLLQAGGLAMTIAGLTVRHDVTVPVIVVGGTQVSFAPAVGGSAVLGTF